MKPKILAIGLAIVTGSIALTAQLAAAKSPGSPASARSASTRPLPRLVDLGADRCVPFFVIGLNLVGAGSLPSWSMPSFRRRGAGGALVLGLVCGAALGPFSFAFMAPLLGIAFASGRADAGRGAVLKE